MSSIISFDTYRRKGGVELMDTLNRRTEVMYPIYFKSLGGDTYNPKAIEDAAVKLLVENDFYPERYPIAIVRLADSLGIKVYKTALDGDFPGNILINGRTADRYGCDKVILTSEDAGLYTQRFIVAHELAHYLFDYPNDESFGTERLFSDNYFKDKHETIPEKRANRFAASILMPRDLFLKQYRIAANHDSRIMFILTYLSKFFEVPFDSVERRIEEVAEFVYA